MNLSSKEVSQNDLDKAIIKRLDALIRLYIETNRAEKKLKMNDAEAARLLKSLDLTPTEIAKILGKKSATDVSQYLYPKKDVVKEKNIETSSTKTPQTKSAP